MARRYAAGRADRERVGRSSACAGAPVLRRARSVDAARVGTGGGGESPGGTARRRAARRALGAAAQHERQRAGDAGAVPGRLTREERSLRRFAGRRRNNFPQGGWPVNPQGSAAENVHAKAGPASAGPGERARLSAATGSLLDRRGDVRRREEPPRYESGLRAHGSNQRFHRLQGHAVARALTTAPSLTDLSPAAARILIPQGWRCKGPPGSLSRKPGSRRSVCGSITTRAAS